MHADCPKLRSSYVGRGCCCASGGWIEPKMGQSEFRADDLPIPCADRSRNFTLTPFPQIPAPDPCPAPTSTSSPSRAFANSRSGWCASWRARHMTPTRSEEHTSELQYLMRISYAVFSLQKKTQKHPPPP